MKKAIKEFIENRYERADYPTLCYQSQSWSSEQPLRGLKVLDSTPVFGNTLAKYVPLLEAGAEVTFGLSSVMPYDREVVGFLHGIGVRSVTPEDALLHGAEFDVILDCAAAFSSFTPRVGYVELTRSGVEGYINSDKPVFLADSSRIKRIETSLGTGDGYFRAMKQLGYEDENWVGRKLLIFGAGKVGRGIELYGKQYGAEVVVFDENSPSDVVRSSIADAYAVVAATGVVGALSCYADDLMACNALIANMGVKDEFGRSLPAERVLAQKRPLNFILSEPTHLRYIETTMALHNYGAIEILKHRDSRGLIEPAADMEAHLLEIVAQNGCLGDRLDAIL